MFHSPSTFQQQLYHLCHRPTSLGSGPRLSSQKTGPEPQLTEPQETPEGTFLVTQVLTAEHRPSRLCISGVRRSTHTTRQACINLFFSVGPAYLSPSQPSWFIPVPYLHCNELTSLLRLLVLRKQERESQYHLDGIHSSQPHAQMSPEERSNTLHTVT